MPVGMKAITPAKLTLGPVRLKALNAMRKVGTQVRDDFQKTTSTWKHKPAFEQSISLKTPGPTLTVWTNDEIYGYVNYGTKRHPIGPKNASVLAWKSGFYPKTFAGVIGSVGGGSFGPMVFSKGFIHPGTKPRNFDKTIQKKWQPKFTAIMNAAIREAAKASGHAA